MQVATSVARRATQIARWRPRGIHLAWRRRRTRLPNDWWEQFERDFTAYADPVAVRAREEERFG